MAGTSFFGGRRCRFEVDGDGMIHDRTGAREYSARELFEAGSREFETFNGSPDAASLRLSVVLELGPEQCAIALKRYWTSHGKDYPSKEAGEALLVALLGVHNKGTVGIHWLGRHVEDSFEQIVSAVESRQ